jgi:hypothetical protein
VSKDESDELDATLWPSTVSDAASRILADLSPAETLSLASASDEDLLSLHFGMGMQIRNNFGLWSENIQLLDDCTRTGHLHDGPADGDIDEMSLFVGRMDVDGASHTILVAARDLARSMST